MTETEHADRRHLRFIKLVVTFSILLGIGSIGFTYRSNQNEANQRNADRIATDVAGCVRGNDLRLALSNYLGRPQFTPRDPSSQDAKDFAAFVKAVQPVNCQAVVVGADTLTTTSTSTTTKKESP